MSEGPVIIEGPEQIAMARLITLAHALTLEIVTGMKTSRRVNLLASARAMGVVPDDGTRPQKKKLLRLTVAKIRETVPDYEPGARMQQALDS